MSDFPQRVRAVLFDFDGTLADSYAAITASVNHVRSLHQLPPLSVAEVNSFVGFGPEYMMAQTVPGADVEAALASYRQHHPTVMYALTRLLPGAAELLHALKRTGRSIALCSNKPRFYSDKLLQHLEVRSLFDVVVGPEDVAAPKPAPDMLVAALRRLQVAAPEALYVGDMIVDIDTARAAKVAVATVATGSQTSAVLAAAAPDWLLSDLHELSRLLQM